MNNYPRLTIAGIRGGSGKTTLCLGLIASLNARGLKVIPYKKGPDYIDAGWMSVAAKNPCYNLDTFLISKEKVLNSFISHSTGDIAIIEGNRGLYDGMDTEGSYSTAELSKAIKSPVILIIDCTKMTRTASAIVMGCTSLDKNVVIRGVVLNQVSGDRHVSVIRNSIEKDCSLPVLGAIPRSAAIQGSPLLSERHMGLTPYQEHGDAGYAIGLLKDIAEKYLDIEGILKIAKEAEPLEAEVRREKEGVSSKKAEKGVRIGIIRDTAFQFYYPENLEELQKNGAELIDINAIEDDYLPEIDALYIGGGFPETNAIKLAENRNFRGAVKKAAEDGLPIYAECGGLMFLGEEINVNGRDYPMAGIFPLRFEMKKKPQAHGYTIVEIERANPFYPVGTILHGHEFHYSAVVGNFMPLQSNGVLYTAFKMKRGYGIRDKIDGICYKNVLATYTHIHAYGAPEWVAGLLNKAREFRVKKSL